MKITNNVNNNSDFLSISNKGDDNASLLGSLFSINISSNELKSNNISDDFEFVLKKDEIEILEYLSHILPNLKTSNLNSVNLKSVKSEVQSDQSIKSEIKDKIFSFLDSTRKYNKNIFIKFPAHNNFKELNNKIKNESFKSSTPVIKSGSTPVIKSLEQSIDKSRENNPEANFIKKNTNEIIKSEQKLDNHQTLTLDNKQINFVKKIKKNSHPNKLYQLSHSNSFQHKEKIDSTSLTDSKLSNNTNLNHLNNQVSDELVKNKMNEIKVNDKVLNIQSSIESGSKGNQFSQQNHTSLANGGFNSVLEGLLETLDLTQKGWTSKLVSRIENALVNGGEEIEFNLKPKNLGRLKVSISLKNGTGNVKIITENTFVTSALTQNENHLQKLFNDQGIDLEFLAHDDSKYFGSKNSFNKNPNKNGQNNLIKSEAENEQKDIKNSLDENVSSRHIVNVIA